MSTQGTSPTLTLLVRAPEALATFAALAKGAKELRTELAALGSGPSNSGVTRLNAEVRELKASLATTRVELEALRAAQANVSKANIQAVEQESRARKQSAKTAAAEEKEAIEQAAAYKHRVMLRSAEMTGSLAMKEAADREKSAAAQIAAEEAKETYRRKLMLKSAEMTGALALKEAADREKAEVAKARAAERSAAAQITAAERAAAAQAALGQRGTSGIGRSAARGLAGSTNSLWLTYGQSIPALVGGYAAGSFAKNTIETGSEFQYQTAFSGALGGHSPEELAKIREELIKMGTDSIYGPLELAKGMRVLEQAGIGANDALRILPVSMKVAQQGETDLKTSSESLVAIMRQYGKTVQDIPSIGDAVSYTASKTQASVTSLMSSLKSAAGINQLYGVDLNSELALLGMLAKQGITDQTAGTLSRRMFEHLYTPTSVESQRVMRDELGGFSAFNKNGSRRDSREALTDFMGRLQPFDEESKQSILSKVFDVRGLKSASTLVTDITDEFGKLRAELDKSGGALDAFTKSMSGEVKNLWKEVKSNFEGALIESFKGVEEPLRNLLSEMRDFFKDEGVRDFLKLAMMIPQGYMNIASFALSLRASKSEQLDQLNQDIDSHLQNDYGFDLSKRGKSGGAIKEEQGIIEGSYVLRDLVQRRDALANEIGRARAKERADYLAEQYAPTMAGENARLAGHVAGAPATPGKRASLLTRKAIDAKDLQQLASASEGEATAAMRREKQRLEDEANYAQRLLDQKHRYGLISESEYTDAIEALNDKRVENGKAALFNELKELQKARELRVAAKNYETAAERKINDTKRDNAVAEIERLTRESAVNKQLREDRLKGEAKVADDETRKLLEQHEVKKRLYVEQRDLATQVRLMAPEDAAAALAGFDAAKEFEPQLGEQRALLGKTPEGEVKQKIRERIRLLKEQRDAAVQYYGDEARAKTQLERSYQYGADTAFREYVSAATNSAQQARDAWSGTFHTLEGLLTQFVIKGKMDWRSLGDFILETLVRIQIQRAMAGVIGLFMPAAGSPTVSGVAPGSTSIFGGVGSSTAHTGGVLGYDSLSSKIVSPFVFSGAPRYHTGGLVGDEMPVIAKRGEGIFTPEQMRALAPAGGGVGNIRVEMHNEGTAQQVTGVQPRFDAEGLVLRVITQDLRVGGPVSRAMQNRYSLQNQPAA
jgi:TP901 family phage tail tape measure protein/lambda family phage tail tape measure protein